MTIDMDPFNTTTRGADGAMSIAPSGIHFHFHAPTTIVLHAPGRLVDEEPGGEDELPDEAGPSVLAPLSCESTKALPATHPNNTRITWTMPERYPDLYARSRALSLPAKEDDEDVPDEPTDQDEESERRGWFRRKRRATVDAG